MVRFGGPYKSISWFQVLMLYLQVTLDASIDFVYDTECPYWHQALFHNKLITLTVIYWQSASNIDIGCSLFVVTSVVARWHEEVNIKEYMMYSYLKLTTTIACCSTGFTVEYDHRLWKTP